MAKYKNGFIEVICGPMFSEKTTQLLRTIQRIVLADKKYVLFKPKKDDRYSEDEVVSHANLSLKAHPLSTPQEMYNALKNNYTGIYNVGIDEAQFFDNSPEGEMDLVELCSKLRDEGYRVYLSGLDMDANGKPFGKMPQLLAIADSVRKQKAICCYKNCANEAGFSYMKNHSKENVENNIFALGEKDLFEARCHRHWLLKE